jgi:hypothetical protein
LTLSNDQKIQRSKVALPFLKAQSDIVYQVEVADDFDDEDPDDDLDI